MARRRASVKWQLGILSVRKYPPEGEPLPGGGQHKAPGSTSKKEIIEIVELMGFPKGKKGTGRNAQGADHL